MAPSTRRDHRPDPESEGGRVIVLLVLGLALLAGGCYATAYLAASDKVPVGTSVGGVDIGGHHPVSAAVVLRDVAVPAERILTGLTTEHVRGVAAVILGAEACGVAGWAVDTAAAYARTREQFGRPIGQFQGVKHKCARMLI